MSMVASAHVGLVLLALLVQKPAAEQPAGYAIALTGVPAHLMLPLPSGSNEVLTATITGSPVRAVWIARDRAARGRVALSAAKPGVYQINLGDADLWALLRGSPERPGFQVFAETTDGQVIGSIRVQYQAAFEPPPTPTVTLRGADGGIAPRDGSSNWVAAEALAQIDLDFESSEEASTGVLQIDTQTWPFAAVNGLTRQSIAISPEIRAAWTQEGRLEVLCRTAQDRARPITSFRPLPRLLESAVDQQRVVIDQRQSLVVPGSRGYLSLRLGDITGGQVQVWLRADTGRSLVEGVSFREGQEASFTIGSERYVLVLDRLINHLVGHDQAEFLLLGAARREQRRITCALDLLRESGLTFLREGQSFEGPAAADHLRAKFLALGDATLTLEDFIEQVASRSSATGTEYRVRLAKGGEEPLGAWMRERTKDECPGP